MMKVYNTLTKEKEDFVPLEGKRVKMYVCGPTVYDHAHLGHARAAVAFDVIRRFLEHEGYHVSLVQNFTDVDDKILKKAKEERTTIFDVSRRYALSYLRDMDLLGVRRADFYPLATETIPIMQKVIQGLIDKGHAYAVPGGDVYFDTESLPSYGKLSKKPKQEMEGLAGRDGDRKAKRNLRDFALWKARASDDEVGWDSPWGRGRPGWHIECSAMNLHYLGESIDIHGGGQDLIFPHHENEVAQCEALTSKPFVKYWLHNGFVNVNREKMSKSLGNFFTVKELLKEFTGDEVRLFLLTSYYRKPVEFTREILQNSTQQNRRIEAALEFLEGRLQNANLEPELIFNAQFRGNYELQAGKDQNPITQLQKYRDQFLDGMRDDFNTPIALAELTNAVKIINGWGTAFTQTGTLPDTATLRDGYILLREMLSVLGLYDRPSGSVGGIAHHLQEFVEKRVTERAQARKDKNFQKADEIRKELGEIGVEIKDAATGSTWSWKKN